jgi:mercuric reductase
MKMKLTFITSLPLLGLAFAALAGDNIPATANATNFFTITGMHCDGCAGGLTAELKETRGVAWAQVTFSNKLAVVAIDTNKISTAQLTKVIKAAGFAAKPLKP